MLGKQFRRSEALLIFEVVGNNRLSGPQRVTAGRFKVGSNTCRANNPFFPANSGTNQKSAFRRDILQDFAVFGFQSLGCNASAVLEHVHKARTLERKDAELREQFLLPNALPESATRQVLQTVV